MLVAVRGRRARVRNGSTAALPSPTVVRARRRDGPNRRGRVRAYRYYYRRMVRIPLTPGELARGARLGAALRRARGNRTMTDVAAMAGISVETLRKIETGRIPTPAFFTVAALCEALTISLDTLADSASGSAHSRPEADVS